MVLDADGMSLELLRRVALLEGLGDAVLGDVALSCHLRRFRARQELFARDDVDRDCYLVLSGRLRAIAWSPAGREVMFRDVHAGETIGEMAAIDGRPRSATVVAMSDTLVARLSPEVLFDLMQRHWPICERMLCLLAASTRELTERVYELCTLDVQQRLCAELVRLALGADRAGDRVTLAPCPSHAELAARIGSVKREVTRVLTELRAQGLIERMDRGPAAEAALTIVDVRHLARCADSRGNGPRQPPGDTSRNASPVCQHTDPGDGR